MTLLQRLNLERARLGYKFPTTVKEVEASEVESNGIPNSCPVACSMDGKPGIFALHSFSDGDTWLVRLHDHSDDWVTQRVATDFDKQLITAAIKQDCCEMHSAYHQRIAELETALRGIQEMASEDLRLGDHPLQTYLFQIEADARAALVGTLDALPSQA